MNRRAYLCLAGLVVPSVYGHCAMTLTQSSPAGGSAKYENQVRFYDVSVIEVDPDVMKNSASVN